MSYIKQSGTPVNLTASGAIGLSPGTLIGFYINSTTAGTIVLLDGGSTGTEISGTIVPAIGWHTFPAEFASAEGPYATIAGTALDVTFFFAAGP